MDQIKSVIDVIQAIMNGVKSPIKAAIGGLVALFLYFFIMVQSGKLRARKAEAEKEEQKDETNIDLENRNAEADRNVRDRLEQRKL
jgi:C4-dicarboxylate-specific signal transduction histidine kinase